MVRTPDGNDPESAEARSQGASPDLRAMRQGEFPVLRQAKHPRIRSIQPMRKAGP